MVFQISLKKTVSVLLLMVVLGIVGCTTQTPITTEQPEEVLEETLTPTAVDTAAVPTATQSISDVLFAAGPDADPFQAAQIQTALDALILDGEQRLVVESGISPDQVTDNVEVVVGVGPGLDLANLAAAAPQTQFVSVGQPGVVPSTNLSVIGDPLIDQQHQSFLAGYLAALTSSDYKVAALIPSDSEQTDIMLDSFLIGTRFFCGICKPLYPPYNTFPMWETLPVEDATDGFQPVVDALVNNGVEVLYLQGELQSPQILTYLADAGVKVVSDQNPDVTRNNWIGTVAADPGAALAALWPDLMAGAGGTRKASSLTLIDTEAGLLSDGRRRLFDQMLVNLQAGLVLPQSVP